MIEVENVGVDRPERPVPVLDGVQFSLAPGERVALLGGNGSGKTTLARLLNGTQLPSRGRVCVDGLDTRQPIARLAVRRAVGLLFQDPDDQFVSTTAEREIAFGLENLGVETGAMRPTVDAALRDFDLEAHRQSPPHEMSGGEKARLALACVWVMQPRCIVLDETDSLLDRRGRERLAALVAQLPPATTRLQVTTDPEIAAACERVLVLHSGRLIADGPPDVVFGTLPAEVVARTGLPLAWRVSSRLAAGGHLAQPTASFDKLFAATRAGAGAGANAPLPNAMPVPDVDAVPNVAPDSGSESAAPALVRAEAVDFSYDSPGHAETWGLRAISLAVRPADRVGLLGASGSGKSTLLHLLAGLLRPRHGRVDWGSSTQRVASLVFQFPERQLFAETVHDDVAYGLRQSGVAAPEVELRVAAALENVGLSVAEFAERAPFHLSGGEMRRVAIAGAMAQRRPLLLLDEPTLGLDAEGVARLRDILVRLHARGIAYWVASHDADFLAATCERAVVLEAGRVAYDGELAVFWGDAERAARLGVELPSAVGCAARLQALGAAPPGGLDDAWLAAGVASLMTPR